MHSLPVSIRSTRVASQQLTYYRGFRRRKMVRGIFLNIRDPSHHYEQRCDGQRPACSQCIRAERNEDCEYLDGPGPTPIQEMEQYIATLEARITEFMAVSAPVALHDPYEAWHRAQAQRSAQPDPMRILYVLETSAVIASHVDLNRRWGD